MSPLGSLRSRVFVATATVAALALLLALGLVTSRAGREAEAVLRRDLQRASRSLFEQQAARGETLRMVARLLADLPKLKAAVDTGDPATVAPVARDYRVRARADLLFVSDRSGRVLHGGGAQALAGAPEAGPALARESVGFEADAQGLMQVVRVPILLEADVLGVLGLGFLLDDAEAQRFKTWSDSEIAIAHGGRIRASTLARDHDQALLAAAQGDAVQTLRLGGDDWLCLARPLESAQDAPRVLLLRSRSESLAFLRTLREGLLLAALLAALLAVVLSWGVARSVTRPLSGLTAAMRAMAETGDLTPRLPSPGRLDDEDAVLVARSFGGLAAALERFQREAALRDRLSALGRLSTVIAHEVRNPLMSIKASLATLRSTPGLPAPVVEAASDIEHEAARLNRIVGDVLDFARPVRVEYARVAVNALVREAALAVLPDADVSFDLDQADPQLETDPDRLRGALVNVLQNARDAMAERPQAGAPGVCVSTRCREGRVVVGVADRGPGIRPEHQPHLFEPYFTTNRSGTGLGLAIAKNVIDALRGSIAARARDGGGTEMAIELPQDAPQGAR